MKLKKLKRDSTNKRDKGRTNNDGFLSVFVGALMGKDKKFYLLSGHNTWM